MTTKENTSYTKTVFVSGATGFIGSHLVAGLLKDGCRVIAMSRGKGGRTPRQRLLQALFLVDSSIAINDENLIDISGCMDENADVWIRQIRGRVEEEIDEIWHLAAIFKINKQTQEEVKAINISGVISILELARKVNARKTPRYFHVSTAYSQGRSSELITETIIDDEKEFRSLYDWSKNAGERQVKEYQKNYQLDATIFRPSIVVSSFGGKVVNNAAYYTVLETFYSIAKRAEVSMGEEYDGNIGIRFSCEPEAQLNIVPIDFVIDAMRLLANKKESINNDLKIFNIVNENPPSINLIRDIICESLKVTGIETVDANAFEKEQMTSLERLVERRIVFQAPYARENTLFSVENFRALVSKDDLSPPNVDAEFLLDINRNFIEMHEKKLQHSKEG
jgi:nucleoside-diphosphate-sugar epimerase